MRSIRARAASTARNLRPRTIDADFIAQQRQALLHDKNAVPLHREKRYGPRTRREFLALRRWEEFFKLS